MGRSQPGVRTANNTTMAQPLDRGMTKQAAMQQQAAMGTGFPGGPQRTAPMGAGMGGGAPMPNPMRTAGGDLFSGMGPHTPPGQMYPPQQPPMGGVPQPLGMQMQPFGAQPPAGDNPWAMYPPQFPRRGM